MQKLIDYDWPAGRLNRFLRKEYGYDLFDFAYSLAIVLAETVPLGRFHIWNLKKEDIRHYRTAKTELTRLKKLRLHVVKELSQHLTVLKAMGGSVFPREILPGIHIRMADSPRALEDIINHAYGIESSLTTEINVLSAALGYFERSKGAPAKSSTLISCLWSFIIKGKRGAHLYNIENLLNWFYEKLDNTCYREEISTSPSVEEISRFKKRHGQEVEEDVKKIFVANYKMYSRRKQPFPFAVRFDKDTPRLVHQAIESRRIERRVLFPCKGKS